MTNIFFVKKQKSNRHQTHNKRHKSLSKFFSLRFIDSRDCSKCRVTHSFCFFFFFVRGNVCLTLSLVFATKNFFVCDKFSPIAHFLRKSATFDRHSFEPKRSEATESLLELFGSYRLLRRVPDVKSFLRTSLCMTTQTNSFLSFVVQIILPQLLVSTSEYFITQNRLNN